MADDKPKIFIDEDWKAQVQREKEQMSEQAGGEDQQGDARDAGPDGEAQPAADFSSLVQSLATQCLFALGLIAPPDVKEVMVDIAQAKYLIDTLMVLRDKTQGNLTPEEEGVLSESISELQRVYVLRTQQAQEASLKQAGIDLNNLKNPQ